MDHYLVQSIEKALGWNGSQALGKGFAHGSMADPELCTKLLTPTQLLNMIMRRSLSKPQFRCFRGGEELDSDTYLRKVVTRRGQSQPMANMKSLSQLMQSGCTIVLDTLDSFDPTMEIACQALQWWSRELVQVNSYLTTNEAAGFNLHWDDHDVIIIQLSGEKSWEVRGTSRTAPMYRDVETNNEPSEDIVWSGTMRTGDVIHIPRGYWHQATRVERGSGHSLHLTFGFVQRTGVDWLSWITDQSRHSEAFRRNLDRGGSSTELAVMAAQLIADHPQEVYLAAREQERPARRRVVTSGVFGAPTDVVCLTDFPPHIQTHGDTIVVKAAGKKITFVARAEPALRLLLSGNPANIEQITQATGIPAAVLANTLLDEEICAELTDELASGFLQLRE